MFDILRGNGFAAGNGPRRFADRYAVQRHDIAGRNILGGEFMLGFDIATQNVGFIVPAHLLLFAQVLQRNDQVIGRVNF